MCTFQLRLSLFLLLSLSVTLACQSTELPTSSMLVGQQLLTVELAIRPPERANGLMYRQSMAQNRGMLFVFQRDQVLNFYMKNTLIPLSIAYIDSSGVILEIHDMEPETLKIVGSSWPVRYALEVNQGWFTDHQVKVGDKVELPANLQH